MRALETQLPAALDGDPGALHRARVASRRVREVLPLVPDAPSGAKKRVRRLTQWLGRVREMDVALGLLADEETSGRIPRAALGEARQQLQIAREKRREKLLEGVGKLDREKLARALRKLIARSSDEDVDVWRRTLAARLARRVNVFRRGISKAGAIYVPERLHAVRIAAKKLRYALEIAAELGVPGAAKEAAIIRRTQVTLGDLQDRHILSRHLHAAAAQDSPGPNGLATLESELEASCRELHAVFLSQREALNGALTAIRQQVVPALAHSTRRGRSLKAATATVTNGKSDRAIPDSARARRGARRRLA